MKIRLTPVIVLVILLNCFSGTATAQDKSVKPGINDPFRNPDLKEFVGKFEVESREVFARRNEILAACRIQPGQTVADIGAGTGLFTQPFSDAVGDTGRVIAVDISQKFLDHIQQASRKAGRKNVDTLLCKPDSTELPPNSIDVAFVCDTYHHFEFPLKTMTSLYRALKPGGRIILVDFRRVEGKSTDWVLSHVRAGQEVFETEISRTGFRKVREERELLKENYFVEFEKPALVFPIISKHGGVLPRPQAAEQPRAGAKTVLDITGDGQPGESNKGLERAARLLNLYGSVGLQATDIKITLVLHGEATKRALSNSAYKLRYGVEQNPDLPLIHELKQAGVEIFVCGQALNNKGFADAEVAEDVTIAASALTVVINRQADGYSFIPVP